MAVKIDDFNADQLAVDYGTLNCNGFVNPLRL
ncbi:hypothetical protein SAMN04488552_0394 [Christiangramia echinicola]|uniref:Uncharacterized protein n=1 Tax=Christiangramia echinicola TaxID=279359 RepID=A0A1H1KYI0_9FLAO|nr:hypothetical protein SAMN04488552_0394 [Christiangramia echinicola]